MMGSGVMAATVSTDGMGPSTMEVHVVGVLASSRNG